MRKLRLLAVVVPLVLFIVSTSAPIVAQGAFEDCADWRPTNLELTLEENETVTATLEFQDKIFEDGDDILWRESAFTDYVQSYAGGNLLNQLSLYWASDQTGWSPNANSWQEHDSEYYDQWYREDGMVVVKLKGIPYPGKLKGQFVLINEKKPDVEMFLNPVHTCNYEKFFVEDCMEPQGHLINGSFNDQGEFSTTPLQCDE